MTTRTLVLLAWAGASALPASAATFTATVRATSGTSNLVGPTDTTDRRSTSGWQLAAHSSVTEHPGNDALGRGQSHAIAYVLPGGLQWLADAGSSSSVTAGSMSGAGSATASGSFDDAFTLLVPGCANLLVCGAGRQGSMTFAIGVNGRFGGSGSATLDGPGGGTAGWTVSGGWSADVRVNAGFISGATEPTSVSWSGGQSRSQTSTTPPVITGSGSFGSRPFTVGFVFGQAINVHLAGSVNASSVASGFAGNNVTIATGVSAFTTDLFDTIAWGGISEVRDSTGQLLSGWSASSSSSGFDYAQPYRAAVPEPATWVLMCCGVAGLLCRRRSCDAGGLPQSQSKSPPVPRGCGRRDDGLQGPSARRQGSPSASRPRT